MKAATATKLLIGLAFSFAAACADSATSVTAVHDPRAAASSNPVLVECPTDEFAQSSELLTSLGGSVSAGGTTITVPAGALLVPTTITVTVPPSQFMEVDITANDASSFVFQLPVTVSLSYARCTRSDIEKDALSVWYIDSATKALLQNMRGDDDKDARTVTFTTDHLSGYAVAN